MGYRRCIFVKAVPRSAAQHQARGNRHASMWMTRLCGRSIKGRVRAREILICVALASIPSVADAQPNCKKGIPCGNSCIAATKTCRIGTTPPASPAPQPASQVRTLLDQAPRPFDPIGDSAWVASVDGNVYYKADCPTAMKLHPDERHYFRSEAEARLLRYVRSKAKGC